MATKDTDLQILEALKMASAGITLDEIIALSGLNIEKRSLQRQLSKLRSQGDIEVTGRARAIRYQLPDQLASQTLSEPERDLIPLPAASKKLLSQLSQPIQRRKPVGYNEDFLASYRPNIDSYLSEENIRHLAELGNTAKLDQPAGTYAQQILNRLLIDLSWNSSRLEGNTYTLLDTERLISLGEADDSKSALEAQMIINHKEAIEFIVQAAEDIGYNRSSIQNLHSLLASELLSNPEAPGRLRSIGVGISKSVYTPLLIPQLIEENFALMLQKAAEIENPFEQSFFIMVQLPYLQPFDDVNKRVSRLAANISLIKQNLSPLSFVDVPNHFYIQGTLAVYELNDISLLRDVYLWAYERSASRYAALRQSLGEPDPFRLKHRTYLREIINQIVMQAMDSKKASEAIETYTSNLPEKDRPKFIETVETELLSLHEGNFARYRVKESEFRKWHAIFHRKL